MFSTNKTGKDLEKKKKSSPRTTPVVQWLRLPASTAGSMGLIPGQGTKIPHAMKHSKNK